MNHRSVLSIVAAVTLALTACSSDNDSATDTLPADTGASTAAETSPPGTDPAGTEAPATATTTTTTEPPASPADAETVAAIETAIDGAPAGCDPLDTRQCLLPFPSDAYLVEDPSTASGNRVDMPADALPTNASGVRVDPTAWNDEDGFSANASILTFIADFDPTGLPTWTDLGASLDDGATVVLVDTATGARVPLWAEPDVGADDADERLLVIHPAVGLEPETTYAVGLHGLTKTSGDPIDVSPVFVAYRDRLTTEIDAFESRRDSMEETFDALEQGGVSRDDLQLAWSFTTASTANTTAGILKMRDETMAALGDSTPEFTITAVDDDPADEGLARIVQGTYSVPNYMTGDGAPGTRLNIGPDGLPVQNEENPTLESVFGCEISDATVAGTEPAHMVQYGHGLLGSWDEIDAGNINAMSNEHNTVYCATNWAGFSEDDIGTAAAALGDMNGFPTFTDRMSQGLLNQLVLSRLMLAENGLITEPSFWFADGTPLIDNSELFYDGNSQGGIMGLALSALSQDFERSVLGVVGQNYSTLLPRSVDFDEYEAIFIPAYPSALDRELLLSVIQMQWDRAEGSGYLHNLVSDPLPATPAKTVLMHVAFGDWQVSELTAMIAARTMGVPISRPVTADGRSREVEPGWGLDTLEYPSDGSGLVIWDSGSDPIPIEQVAPNTSRDPHGDPRNDAVAREQKAAFLFDGQLIDVCDGAACTAQPDD